jgi:predicted transcriptional regulator
MPAQGSHLGSTQDLTSLLGPRQADVMRLLWTRGLATVRQLLTWLTADPPIVYQTIMTICVRLTEKGLLERRLATSSDESARYGQAYVYAPRVSEDEFLRTAVRQQSSGSTTRPLAVVGDQARVEQALAYLGTLRGE